jgi:hypothetical protein
VQEIRLEILEASYWEHFKFAKDLSLYLPLDHPKRKVLESEINKLLHEINSIKEKESKTDRSEKNQRS